MKVVLRDPPLLLLLIAIVLDMPLRRVSSEARSQGWVGRLISWRDQLSRRAG